MWRDIGRYIDTDLNEVELFQSLVIIQGARIIEIKYKHFQILSNN